MPSLELSPDVLSAFDAFISGLADGRSVPQSTSSFYPRSDEEGPLQVLYSLGVINGSALFRHVPDNLFAFRFNVAPVDTRGLRSGLESLTSVLERCLSIPYRPRYSASPNSANAPPALVAFVGFGHTFFFDRNTGTPRFQVQVPRHLSPLKLAGDDSAGICPSACQADMIILLECQSLALLVDAHDELLRYAGSSGWLELLDVRQGMSRGDGRNHLGFYDGVRNPTLETTPSAQDVSLTGESDEPSGLHSGTYLEAVSKPAVDWVRASG